MGGGLQTIHEIPTTHCNLGTWYALHTRFNHEKRIASELQRKGIVSFVPLISETRNWSDRRTKIDVPLFSCYVFINIPTAPQMRVSVLRTSGVLTFVGGNHLPAAIPDGEIQQIQTLLKRKVAFTAHPFLAIGQRVRIRGGALDGIEGILARFKGNDRVVVSVTTIQQSLSITLEGHNVEPIQSTNRVLYA